MIFLFKSLLVTYVNYKFLSMILLIYTFILANGRNNLSNSQCINLGIFLLKIYYFDSLYETSKAIIDFIILYENTKNTNNTKGLIVL